RPLWAGFKVSVPFTLGKPGKSDEDPRRGRLPHDILITNKLIPQKEVFAYELTDMRDIQKLREMYSYIDSFGISEKNKEHLKRLYNSGKVKTKGDVEALAKKVTKQKVKLTNVMLKSPAPIRRGGVGPKPKPVLKADTKTPIKSGEKPPKATYSPTKQHREWVNQFKSVITGKLQAMGAKKIKFIVSGPFNMTDYRAYVTYEAGPNADFARMKMDDAAHGLSKLTGPYFSIVQWKPPIRTLPPYVRTYAKNKYLKFFTEDHGKPFKMSEVIKQSDDFLERSDFSNVEVRRIKADPMSKVAYAKTIGKPKTIPRMGKNEKLLNDLKEIFPDLTYTRKGNFVNYKLPPFAIVSDGATFGNLLTQMNFTIEYNLKNKFARPSTKHREQFDKFQKYYEGNA
ncbi:MAG: hypothetical protein PHF34_08815, partial [Bacteroidales bacterium]|nr:hypothetical protein [Bacteroidales bacterium]